jgi:hypothetical protein
MTELTDYQQWYREVYLRSDHWQNLRKLAFQTYGRICSKCRAIGRLDVHHLRYRNIFDVLVTDLQILCRQCHEREHLPPPAAMVFRGMPKDVETQIQAFLKTTPIGGRNGMRNSAINKTISQLGKQQVLTPEIRVKLLTAKTGATSRRMKRLLAAGVPAETIITASKKALKNMDKKLPRPDPPSLHPKAVVAINH